MVTGRSAYPIGAHAQIAPTIRFDTCPDGGGKPGGLARRAAVTPNKPITVLLNEHGRRLARAFAMPDVHGATMAPIAIAALSALVGLFVLLDGRAADTRVVLAGMRSRALFTARIGVLAFFMLAAVAVSMLTTAVVFDAARWPTYIAANILIGLTYAMIGALLTPIFGRVGGVFFAFMLPFLDLGIVQSPMLHPEPTLFSKFLPGYGGSRVLLDGAFTQSFDESVPLLVALGWLAALTVAVAVTYRHMVGSRDWDTSRPSDRYHEGQRDVGAT